MKLKPVELAHISKYRDELMGTAILFIVFFHVALPRGDMFFGLKRMGNIGVDMFFFLSGVGLWYSWSGQPGAGRFLLRRFLRIYPAWLVMASLYYVPRYIQGAGSSSGIADLAGDILVNWDFWLHDELTFWYIPAIMVLYLFAPGYMTLIGRYPSYRWLPVAMMVWCVLVQWVAPIRVTVGHLEIFWSRVPIFFIGIGMGEQIRLNRTVEGESLWCILLVFVMTLSGCIYMEQQLHGRFPLFIERMMYIPLTVCGILLLNRLFAILPPRVNASLRFTGMLSLEIYLIHVHFVLVHIEKLHLHYWFRFFLCMATTLPLAWLLNKSLGWIVRRLRK